MKAKKTFFFTYDNIYHITARYNSLLHILDSNPLRYSPVLQTEPTFQIFSKTSLQIILFFVLLCNVNGTTDGNIVPLIRPCKKDCW